MTLTALRALLPVAALAGLAACTATAPTPAAEASSTPPASATPASPATPSTAVTASPTRSPSPDTARAVCPVSATTLQRASGLDSSTHRIDRDQIRCARQWATAGVIAVDPGCRATVCCCSSTRTVGGRRWARAARSNAPRSAYRRRSATRSAVATTERSGGVDAARSLPTEGPGPAVARVRAPLSVETLSRNPVSASCGARPPPARNPGRPRTPGCRSRLPPTTVAARPGRCSRWCGHQPATRRPGRSWRGPAQRAVPRGPGRYCRFAAGPV